MIKFSIVRVSQTIKLFSHIQDLFCHVLLRCLEVFIYNNKTVTHSTELFVIFILIYLLLYNFSTNKSIYCYCYCYLS